MILSMTGFGKAEIVEGGMSVSVEVRSLNGRYLDLVFKAPRIFGHKEAAAKELVKRKIDRGKVTVLVGVQSDRVSLASVRVDQALIGQYVTMLKEAAQRAGIPADVRLEHLLAFEDVFSVGSSDDQVDEVWIVVETAVGKALDEMNDMRVKEGKSLARDLRERLSLVRRHIDAIERQSASSVQEELEKLKDRIRKLLDRADLDPQRLDLELALLADKVDITEELVRLRSHLEMFEGFIDSDEHTIGRKLNFIIQEMGREANTISSKSSRSDVIHAVVEIKEELEKLREQVQNVE